MQGAIWELLVLLAVNWVMARQMIRHPAAPFHVPVFAGMGVVLAAFLPAALGAFAKGGPGVLATDFRAYFDAAMQGYRANSGLNKEALAAGAALMERYMWAPFPAWMAVGFMFWLSFNAALLRWWLARSGRIPRPRPLLFWSVPDWTIWVFLAPAFGWLFLDWAGRDSNQSPLFFACINLLVLVLPAYLLQGFLVVQWNLLRLGIPRLAAVAVWPLGFFLLPPGMIAGGVLFLTMLGLMDTWFDFRRLQPPPAAKVEGPEA